jgi:hypothetical protein
MYPTIEERTAMDHTYGSRQDQSIGPRAQRCRAAQLQARAARRGARGFHSYASRAGRYGTWAAGAWLVTMVASGYGVAHAEPSTGSASTGNGPRSTSAAASSPQRSSLHTRAAKAPTALAHSPSSIVAPPNAGPATGQDSRGANAGRASILTASPAGAVVLPAAATASAAPRPPITHNAASGALPTDAMVPPAVTALTNPLKTAVNPLLGAAAPTMPAPAAPSLWGLLSWVRRNIFNEAPAIHYNQQLTSENMTNGVITGNIGATDAENDPLTYRVTRAPASGTLTIDQATGDFTFTPTSEFAQAGGTTTFTVSVSDKKLHLLAILLSPNRGVPTQTISLSEESIAPSVTRIVVPLPDTITHPSLPSFTADGRLLFGATPAVDGIPQTGVRGEIYQMNEDGTGLQCITCGLNPSISGPLNGAAAFQDGSGRILIGSANGTGTGGAIYEPATENAPAQLVPIIPAGASMPIVQDGRVYTIAPDGVHISYNPILYNYLNGIVLPENTVGTLVRTTDAGGNPEYQIVNAHVVYSGGEVHGFTADGKAVIVANYTGASGAGQTNNYMIDLATGKVTQLTNSLDYTEDVALSPNGKWLTVGSSRTENYLTAMTQIVRPSFIPAYIQGAVWYQHYSAGADTTNQIWLNTVQGEQAGENGIPLFDLSTGYTSNPRGSWNAAGNEIVFWESNLTNVSDTRLVVVHLTNVDAGQPVPVNTASPDPVWAPSLGSVAPTPPTLPAPGTHTGTYGGTAVVTTAVDPSDPNNTISTVTYHDYQYVNGQILNGTEQTVTNPSYTSIVYTADVTVTNPAGDEIGDLTANITAAGQFIMMLDGTITSTLNGNTQTITGPAQTAAVQV